MRNIGNRSRLSTFNVQLSTLAAAFLVAITGAAQAQIEPYYNIVSVKSEQLSNAVRIKINADGAVSINTSKWWIGGEYGDYYLIWELVDKQTTSKWSPDCYPKVDKIFMHLDNARPQAGSVVQVGKYPVSHIKFSMTPEKAGRFGLDVEVVLYKPMRVRGLPQFGWDAYLMDHHDPEWFAVVKSSDSRSVIITVASDRPPEMRDHRKLSDVPESDRQLTVGIHDGLLDIHARNAGLAELLDAVSRAAGHQMIAGPAADRVVTAELPGITQEEFAQRIADCYGLVLNGNADRLVFNDVMDHQAETGASGSTERIPVRWITARKALNLLPNFLPDYARVDEGRNELVVSGPKKLLNKVAADIAKIDQPATMVSVKAILIESLSIADLTHDLELDYSNDNLRIKTIGSLDELTFSKTGALNPEFQAKLQSLLATQKGKIKAESSVTVAGGETGEVFGGVDKYITFYRSPYDPTPVVEPVSAGIKLKVTPFAGRNMLTLKVVAEVTEVGEIDPMTRLPVMNTRSAEGTFLLRPGETIMIGGLSQTQQESVVRRIPIIGYLPLVGKLFSKEIKHRTVSDLTVLLTPTISDRKYMDSTNRSKVES